MKTVRNSFDKAILKIIHVSLSGNKTTCLEMGQVKLVFDGTNFFHARDKYLTIIPLALMASESIAHEGERNNVFVKSN